LYDVKLLVDDVARLAKTSALVQTHFRRADDQLKVMAKAVRKVEDRGKSLGKHDVAAGPKPDAADTTFAVDDAAENGDAAENAAAVRDDDAPAGAEEESPDDAPPSSPPGTPPSTQPQ
jgi:hypothetical protein